MKFIVIKKLKVKKIGFMAVVSVASAIATQPAMADSLTFNSLYYSSADTVTIHNVSPSISEHVYSGGFSMKDTTGSWTMGKVTTTQNASFQAWCIDVYANMHSADYTLKGPANYGLVSGNSSTSNTLTSTKVLQLERLASNNLSQVTNAETSSAFQLAAWEIMAGTGTNLNVSNNSGFTVTGDALSADKLANTWLSQLGANIPTMQLYVWSANTPGSTQDLAVFAPVPEPESYAMMLAGLVLIGFMLRRKKSA